MSLTFMTAPIGCPKCRRALAAGCPSESPLVRLDHPDGDEAYAAIVSGLGVIDAIFRTVKTCHLVRGTVLSGESLDLDAVDSVFSIDGRGLTWVYRSDR